jgi:hypothetical protein
MRQARRVLACIVLPIQMVACSTWQTVPPGPDRATEIAREERVRVTLVPYGEREVKQPQLGETELRGFSGPCIEVIGRTSLAQCEPVAIPLTEISEISAQQIEPVRTVLAVGLGVLTLGAAVFAMTWDGLDLGWSN